MSLGLSQVNILDFSARIVANQKKGLIDFEALLLAFEDTEFGYKLLSSEETQLKLLLDHPLFKHQEKLSTFSVVCLGLIYA